MTKNTFAINGAKNFESALATQWIESLEQIDLDMDREYYALFISDQIVRDENGLDECDYVTDYDRTACADMLTLANIAGIVDLDALGAALLNSRYIAWDETETGLQLVA